MGVEQENRPEHDDSDVAIQFLVTGMYAPAKGRTLQSGSKYSLAPFPAAVEYEDGVVSDEEWVLFVWHTPMGVTRYPMPKPMAIQAWERLGKHLGVLPSIEIAREMPPEPNGSSAL